MKIANLIEEESELEAEIYESEEIQETISQQTTQITQVMEQNCRERAPPTWPTQTATTTNTETIQQETQLKKRIMGQSHHPS